MILSDSKNAYCFSGAGHPLCGGGDSGKTNLDPDTDPDADPGKKAVRQLAARRIAPPALQQ
jgi:hypothetical protein